jgi:hypothetical protein
VGDVIQLDRRRKPSAEILKLFRFGCEVDALIVRALNEIPAQNIAGILAHRLGNLIGHVDHRDELWEVCFKILCERIEHDSRSNP